MTATDPRLLLLAPGDTVYVLRGQVEAGEMILVDGAPVVVPQRLGLGHKIARVAVAPGGKVLKYGAPIGSATQAIRPGDHVHLQNLRSDYTPTHSLEEARRAFEAAQGEKKA
jgi:hypothetical protein